MYGRKRRYQSQAAKPAYYRLESGNRPVLQGFSDGDIIKLRDEFGREWLGTAEPFDQDMFRLRFRDEKGNPVSGVMDRSGITLRDMKGKTWRGFAD